MQIRKNLAKGLLRKAGILALFLFGITTIVATRNGDPDPDPPPFTMAYLDTSFQLRIRWSSDGNTWQDASGATPSIDRAPGLAVNPQGGIVYLAVFADSLADARFMMGLGPANWDSSPFMIGNGHRGDIDSGPSVAHVDANDWLVAHRRNNQAVVREFDTTTTVRDFGATITPVSGVTNAGLTDKPGIAILGSRVLVSWLMGSQLQMVTGDLQGGNVTWQAGYLFNTNVVEPGFRDPVGAHDIVHDGSNFYAAVVRQRDPRPGEQLQRHFLFIYTSSNGQNWTLLDNTKEVLRPESMSIAARAQDDVLAMLSVSANFPPPVMAFRFNGNTWTQIASDTVLGSNPMNKGHDFTLIAQ